MCETFHTVVVFNFCIFQQCCKNKMLSGNLHIPLNWNKKDFEMVSYLLLLNILAL